VRAVLIALLLATVPACDKGGTSGQTGSGSSRRSNDELAREQERFDAERKPQKVVEALGIKPGSRVADIGASSGLLTLHLARAVKPNGKVVATDIDGAVLELLRARLQAANLADVVEPKVVGPDEPGLEANSFDAILLAEVDQYFSDGVAWIKNATKALKPGGRIVISNRIHHRQKSMASAQGAGLKLIEESTPVPTHFIAVFTAGDNK